ncbi:cation transporter [Devosia sp. CC-YST696]|nr:cation transporter [Devosia faecipullorum]
MEARIGTTRFKVDGMDCASCASKVDTAARRIQGVEDVSVSVVSGTMSVKHSDGADLADLARRVSNQASIQLVDADRRFFGTLAAEEGFDVKLAKVRRIIGEG